MCTGVLVDSEWLRRKVDAVGGSRQCVQYGVDPHGLYLRDGEGMAGMAHRRAPRARTARSARRAAPHPNGGAVRQRSVPYPGSAPGHSQSHKFISALSCPVRQRLPAGLLVAGWLAGSGVRKGK